MGQQQLLLVILVTILVGIATVVAINTFGSSNINANRDAVRNDLAAMGAAAQAWYIKPTMLGGGGNAFTGLTDFEMIGFRTTESEDAANVFTNANGVYTMTVTDANNLSIVGVPTSNAALPSGETGVQFTATITAGGLTIVESAVGG